MRIFLTGGTGFVGSNFINTILRTTDYDIVCLKRSKVINSRIELIKQPIWLTHEIDYLNELSPADFYETVMELADREHVREIQTEDNKVYGCTSNVWVVLEGDKLIFDSSSAFVKGLLTVICSQLSSREDIKNVTLEQ